LNYDLAAVPRFFPDILSNFSVERNARSYPSEEFSIMGRKLYVGNLPFSATEEQLADTFAECGTVDSAKIIMDRETGRSKGFGFVEMSSDDEAQSAIEKFDGHELEGRPLRVNEAKPQERRGGGGRGGFGGGGGRGGNRF
jgi:RNA recognition motif-containing protein